MTVWVKITHPDVEPEGTVSLESLPVHEANGWILVTDQDDTGTIDDAEVETDGEN